MKRTQIIGSLIFIVGVWILYRGYGDAQDRTLSMTHKVIELVAGLVLANVGFMAYRYAKVRERDDQELDILDKVKWEKK